MGRREGGKGGKGGRGRKGGREIKRDYKATCSSIILCREVLRQQQLPPNAGIVVVTWESPWLVSRVEVYFIETLVHQSEGLPPSPLSSGQPERRLTDKESERCT